jgi:O-antigen ligase
MAAMVLLWLLARRWMRARAWWLAAAVMFLVLPATMVSCGRAHPQVAAAVHSLSVHLEIWVDALHALRFSPWLGIGFDYFRHSGLSVWESAPNLSSGAPHAHNIFLQTLLDVGLVGLAAYLAVITFVMRCAVDLTRRRDRNEWVRHIVVGAALSIVSVHVFGLFDAVSLGAKVGIFQWWSCGLILAASRVPAASEGTVG